MSRTQSVTSSQLLLNFTVNHLKRYDVNILSVFNDKLLVGCDGLSELYVYSCEGCHLSIITINDNDMLRDAAWTPNGNIVYTAWNSKKVVLISESGKVITTYTKMIDPWNFNVSNDGIIYLADREIGLYQSTDDGVNWSLVFKSTDGWRFKQVIKVTTDHSDDFWTLEKSNNYNWHLRVYSMDRRSADGNVTWRDINFPTTDGKHIDMSRSRLVYDGNKNIFLNDIYNKAVHVLSVHGQYHCQLLSSNHLENQPCGLTADSKRQLLYIGQMKGVVGMFKITNENGDG